MGGGGGQLFKEGDYFKHLKVGNYSREAINRGTAITGLSESFEVDGLVVKVSGQL